MDNTKIDYTFLKPTATWKEVSAFADEAAAAKIKVICVPPSYVKKVHALNKNFKICTVAGFPSGFSTTAVKAYEIKNAVRNGVNEAAVVINFGDLKSHKYNNIGKEIRKLKEACKDIPLTLIIETSILSSKEKYKLCEVLSVEKPDFVQTATGFLKGTATVEDVRFLRQNLSSSIKIKAAGGIETAEEAEALLAAGADRICAKNLK